MAEKKKFKLTVARVIWPSDPPIIAVLVPWAHYHHSLGPTAYKMPISRAGGLPIAVSISPEGKFSSVAGSMDRIWAKACEQEPPEKMRWKDEDFEGDDPRDFFAKLGM